MSRDEVRSQILGGVWWVLDTLIKAAPDETMTENLADLHDCIVRMEDRIALAAGDNPHLAPAMKDWLEERYAPPAE